MAKWGLRQRIDDRVAAGRDHRAGGRAPRLGGMGQHPHPAACSSERVRISRSERRHEQFVRPDVNLRGETLGRMVAGRRRGFLGAHTHSMTSPPDRYEQMINCARGVSTASSPSRRRTSWILAGCPCTAPGSGVWHPSAGGIEAHMPIDELACCLIDTWDPAVSRFPRLVGPPGTGKSGVARQLAV